MKPDQNLNPRHVKENSSMACVNVKMFLIVVNLHHAPHWRAGAWQGDTPALSNVCASIAFASALEEDEEKEEEEEHN